MNLIDNLFSLTGALRNEYRNFFNAAQVKAGSVSKVEAAYKLLTANKNRYMAVANAINLPGVPWYLIGCIHMRESYYSFNNHLHNGDPLTGRTKNVPAGRPVANPAAGVGKPYSWEESAVDAIKIKLVQSLPWANGKNDSSVESLLNKLEAFNGAGYRLRDIPSPYLWSDSTVQKPGKFTSDGKFNSSVVDEQVGAGTLLKYFLEMEAKKK
jgi:lysozyme family protein